MAPRTATCPLHIPLSRSLERTTAVVAPLVYRRALAVLADLSPESAEYAALGARLRADETGVYALLRSMTGQRAARPQAVGAMQRTK